MLDLRAHQDLIKKWVDGNRVGLADSPEQVAHFIRNENPTLDDATCRMIGIEIAHRVKTNAQAIVREGTTHAGVPQWPLSDKQVVARESVDETAERLCREKKISFIEAAEEALKLHDAQRTAPPLQLVTASAASFAPGAPELDPIFANNEDVVDTAERLCSEKTISFLEASEQAIKLHNLARALGR